MGDGSWEEVGDAACRGCSQPAWGLAGAAVCTADTLLLLVLDDLFCFSSSCLCCLADKLLLNVPSTEWGQDRSWDLGRR